MKMLGPPTNDFQFCGSDFLCEENNSKQVCVDTINGSSHSSSPVVESSDKGESSSKGNDTASIFKYITETLMEEDDSFSITAFHSLSDVGSKPFMLHDSLALLATEKSLYDVLNNDPHKSCSIGGTSSDLMGGFEYAGHDSEPRNKMSGDSPNSSGVKKHRSRDDSDFTKLPMSNKQLANNNDESETLEIYDEVLLCSNTDSRMQTRCETERCKEKQKSQQNEQSKGGPNRGRDGGIKKKKESVVDLRSILMQCKEAVTNYNTKALNGLLLELRQHSSPKGDGMERLAHYFANALEARLAGTGAALYAAHDSKRVSTIEIFKANKMFVTNCPFKHMSNILSNTTIGNLASRATTLHIIDFGIMYGCQWARLIHSLSQRPGGPPKLRITGIDFPQPGFRPAERVVDTCRSLAKYSERFGVPFEYNAIAQKWDTISLEDLKIEENELRVVNSMYRLHHVQDATETGYSPRDTVLNLIQKINPDMFIHGVANGTYNSPLFTRRFKEAFFHFSTMFDMLEALIPRDDEDRLLFEQQFFGKEAMNIIACEGMERVERPETYKQWQWRTERAGFRQVPIDQEIVKRVKQVKRDYHKSFSVEEDGKWVLLGWKGRVIQGFSCWKPTHK